MKNIQDYINEGTLHCISNELIQLLKDAITHGYVELADNKGVKYGISKQNIYKIALDDDISLETFKKTIEGLEKDGIKWKFETDDEWKKAGYVDPLED